MGHTHDTDARKIKLVILRIAFAIQFLLIAGSLQAIEIAYSGTNTLDLRTDVVLESSLDINTLVWGFRPPIADFDFVGDADKKAGFEVYLKSEGLYDNDLPKIIDTAMIWVALAENIELDIGQFKAPFGEEVLWGKKKRPYPFHSVSSKEIAPSRERGIEATFKKLFDLLEIDTGIFNGAGTGAKMIDTNSVLVTGKLTIKPQLGELFDLEAGYSALYQLENLNVLVHTIGQGLFGRIALTFEKDKEIAAFSEYMEKRFLTGAINDTSGWTFGLFNLLQARYNQWEAFGTFEIFRNSSAFIMPNDELIASVGVNYYPVKDLRLTLMYKSKYDLYTNAYSQDASALAFYRF
jgi:hypothetical protein